jgi:hypothetical protein
LTLTAVWTGLCALPALRIIAAARVPRLTPARVRAQSQHPRTPR